MTTCPPPLMKDPNDKGVCPKYYEKFTRENDTECCVKSDALHVDDPNSIDHINRLATLYNELEEIISEKDLDEYMIQLHKQYTKDYESYNNKVFELTKKVGKNGMNIIIKILDVLTELLINHSSSITIIITIAIVAAASTAVLAAAAAPAAAAAAAAAAGVVPAPALVGLVPTLLTFPIYSGVKSAIGDIVTLLRDGLLVFKRKEIQETLEKHDDYGKIGAQYGGNIFDRFRKTKNKKEKYEREAEKYEGVSPEQIEKIDDALKEYIVHHPSTKSQLLDQAIGIYKDLKENAKRTKERGKNFFHKSIAGSFNKIFRKSTESGRTAYKAFLSYFPWRQVEKDLEKDLESST